MELLNDLRPWWGLYEPYGQPMSIVELLANDTITPEAVAQVWWALQRGASLWVVAGPQGAGKTTLSTALVPLLPRDARLYVTSGPRDRLTLPDDRRHVYLLVNELSWHLPFYLSGPAAVRCFELLAEGVGVVGTLHARSAAEALAVMSDTVPRATIARATQPMLIVVLTASRSASGIVRRVTDVAVVHSRGADVDMTTVPVLAGIDAAKLDALAAQVAGWRDDPDKAPRFDLWP